VIRKYLRTNKSPGEKQWHLEKLIGLMSSSDWEEVLVEIEDMLIKEYITYDKATTYEDFIQIQSNVYALKRLSSMNGLSEIIKAKRARASKNHPLKG